MIAYSQDMHTFAGEKHFFPMALQPIFEPYPSLHSRFLTTIRHTVGLLWMSDQSVAEASAYTGQHNIRV
jgi:hypothetical protein